MFSIRSRDWIPVPAEISAGTGIPPYGILNLILLISRDAIHVWLFVGTLIGLLPCYRLMIDPSGNRGGTADNGSATAMLKDGGMNQSLLVYLVWQ